MITEDEIRYAKQMQQANLYLEKETDKVEEPLDYVVLSKKEYNKLCDAYAKAEDERVKNANKYGIWRIEFDERISNLEKENKKIKEIVSALDMQIKDMKLKFYMFLVLSIAIYPLLTIMFLGIK